jgi:hypothetical protein
LEVEVEAGKEKEVLSKSFLATDSAIKYSFMPSESLKSKKFTTFRDNTLKVRPSLSDHGEYTFFFIGTSKQSR